MRLLFLHPSPSFARIAAPFFPGAAFSTRHPGGDWDILVRWGVTAGPDAPFTYNAGWALRNLAAPDALRSLLQVNGVPYRPPDAGPPPQRSARRYRVHLADLQPVGVRLLRGGEEWPCPTLPALRRHRLVTLARRALYALGLHFGAVDLIVDASGRVSVTQVDGAPDVDADTAAAYARALAAAVAVLRRDAAAHPGERAERLLLGADPEFIVVRHHDRALRYASDLFPESGSVGYDRQSIVVRGQRRHPIAEIRPAPSASPYELVANLQQALQRAFRMAPDRNAVWLAGAHPGPGCYTGGHIHFSGTRPTTFLLRALDTYVAVPTLIIEDPAGARSRRPRYGCLGEYRVKAHGGFEYRTLSSWLTGMNRARVTLCLAKLAAVEYPRLTRDVLRTPASHRAFYAGDREAFREHIEALWDDMRATYSYQGYRQDLERTRIWILNRRQWKERVDLKRQWRIV